MKKIPFLWRHMPVDSEGKNLSIYCLIIIYDNTPLSWIFTKYANEFLSRKKIRKGSTRKKNRKGSTRKRNRKWSTRKKNRKWSTRKKEPEVVNTKKEPEVVNTKKEPEVVNTKNEPEVARDLWSLTFDLNTKRTPLTTGCNWWLFYWTCWEVINSVH